MLEKIFVENDVCVNVNWVVFENNGICVLDLMSLLGLGKMIVLGVVFDEYVD